MRTPAISLYAAACRGNPFGGSKADIGRGAADIHHHHDLLLSFLVTLQVLREERGSLFLSVHDIDGAEDADHHDALDALRPDDLALAAESFLIELLDEAAVNLQATVDQTAIRADDVAQLRRPIDTNRYVFREGVRIGE